MYHRVCYYTKMTEARGVPVAQAGVLVCAAELQWKHHRDAPQAESLLRRALQVRCRANVVHGYV